MRHEFILDKEAGTVMTADGEGIIFNFDKVENDGIYYVFKYYGHYIGLIDKRHIIEIIEKETK